MLNRRMELTAVRRDGTPLPVEVLVSPLSIDGKTIFSAFLHDITERKQVEAIREHEATHDPLTGLLNRRGMFDLLSQAIARVKRTRASLALLFIDLDGFKQINDTHGHEAGDAVLREVAARLQASIRQTDTAARLGGDEFTVILENIKHGISDANMLAQKILETLQHPIQLDSVTATISASIGISMHHPYDERSADQLVNAADSAMYTAKHAGKNQVCVHK